MVNHDPTTRTNAFLDDNGEILMRSATNVLMEKHGVHVRALVNKMAKSKEGEESKDYNTAHLACLEVVKDMEEIRAKNPYQPNNKARLLITMADGTVVLDTGKGEKNTFENMKSKLINENHMSRFAVHEARTSEEGIGREKKLSTSTGQYEIYRGQRLGPSANDSMGIVRFSVKA